VYHMEPVYSFQIDEPRDIELIERLMSSSNERRAMQALSDVRLLVLDFDGVMTDNRVLVGQDGKESVWCHRGDGLGISLLKEAGVEVIVLSKEKNPVVNVRCGKLSIACFQGSDDKFTELKRIVKQMSLKPEQVVYVGNDINDLECMKWVGVPVAVADAEIEVAAVARIVTLRKGGQGAVREVCDLIYKERTKKKGETYGQMCKDR
jgi:YrbI family 3-deoxy-D-manno-octulosonate 8-phosphate phosphatase